ncbi:MAG: FHA domain-containing protein, partial [Candidatus Competibacteraceae bacterium]
MSSSIPSSDGTEIILATSQARLRVQFDAIELRVVAGPDTGLEVSLGLPTVRIGTAPDNDIVLSDRAVSRRHAEIRMTPNGLLLRDLNSTNGTFINEVRITEAYIPAAAECKLGYSRLLVRQHVEERKVAVSRQDRLGELVGGSERMRELYGLIRAVAPTPTTVHLHGESGSGKELVARTLHTFSGRSGPLVVFDASVADPEMVRNDLFGHIKGGWIRQPSSRTLRCHHQWKDHQSGPDRLQFPRAWYSKVAGRIEQNSWQDTLCLDARGQLHIPLSMRHRNLCQSRPQRKCLLSLLPDKTPLRYRRSYLEGRGLRSAIEEPHRSIYTIYPDQRGLYMLR